ncbi:MAG: helix-turn-helix transcriptional regulator [Muribaculaceae bacterium]|nr:helix-turn-helix transcriptional regulator [Muribaculaceae bacterium]
MSVKQRLLEFLRTEEISGSEFTRKMGLSPGYLASMRKSMPEEKVEKLIRLYPQLSRDWLLYGEGNMYRDMGESDINPHRLDRHMVPLIPSYAQAGKFELYATGVMESDCRRIYAPVTGASCAIQVKGDSMEPKIHSGTYLFLEKINDKAFIPWGSPLVLDTENGSLVKMLFPSDRGEEYLEARSYNKDYPPFLIPTDSIYGIYRILFKLEEGDFF